MPAGTAANDYVFNSTRNSYAYIDSMAVAVATMQQPMTAACLTTVQALPTPAADDTWATGDTLVIYTPPLCNLKRWRGVSTDFVGAAQSVTWTQWVNVADSSGTGNSCYVYVADGATHWSGVLSSTRVHITAFGGRGPIDIIGCSFLQAVLCVNAQSGFFGGASKVAFNSTASVVASGYAFMLHGTVTIGGSGIGALSGCLTVGAGNLGIFSDAAWTVSFGNIGLTVTPAIWGSYSMTLIGPAVVYAETGVPFATGLVTTGAFKFGTKTTGSAYVGAGVMTDGINLTPANMDAGAAGGAGLQDPLTGARFCIAA